MYLKDQKKTLGDRVIRLKVQIQTTTVRMFVYFMMRALNYPLILEELNILRFTLMAHGNQNFAKEPNFPPHKTKISILTT